MRYWVLAFLIMMPWAGQAACPIADEVARTQGQEAALPIYLNCALQTNDDDTQLYLARAYENGRGAMSKNIQRALLFYHLSADNGNATAQVALADLLTRLDARDDTRQDLQAYLDKIGPMMKKARSAFSGELLPPYALLALAAEKPEQKWFYPTRVKSDPGAARALKAYQITPADKQAAVRAASQWKQRKMLQAAGEVLTLDEYNRFYKTLYPAQGLPDSFARSQAVRLLQERIESRQK